VLDSPARYKLLNCGGRWGKSLICEVAGILGHGPRQADGTPLWRGAAQGGYIAWVAPDFPQARAIWRVEIVPRFSGKEHLGVSLSESERRLTLPGGGFVEIRSAENIDSLRGHPWDGVIFDEGREYDLRYAWEDVVSLRLVDRKGWAMFPSTPHGGLDGNPEKIIPSYFNRLCMKGQAGELEEGWQYWHFTTRDNPMLPRDEVERIYRVTPKESMKYRQEMQAELVLGGGGLAFPEWRPDLHITARFPDSTLRDEWHWYGGLDWGYTSPGVYVLFGCGPDDRKHVRLDVAFERMTPAQVVEAIVDAHRERQWPFPRMIGCDAAMQQRSGVRSVWEAFTEAWGEALGREGRACPLVPVSKSGVDGKGHRASRKLMLHELLAWEALPDGRVAPWQEPRLTFHPEAQYCRNTFPRLMQSVIPGEEDVDTTGPDHGYDALGYGLWLRPEGVRGVEPEPSRDVLVRDADGRRVPRGRVPVLVGERGYGTRRLRSGRTPEAT